MSSLIKGPLVGAAAVRELTGPDPIMAAFERAPLTTDALSPAERADLDRRRAALPGEIAAGRMRTTEQVQATIDRMRAEQEGATATTTPGHVWRGGVLVPVADVENDGDRGPRAPKASKPFPMPGTSWRWLGNEQAPTPTGPHRVESLRWFRGCAEAVFAADARHPGYSCAGVDHMMALDAWECIPGEPRRTQDPLSVLDQAADAQRAAHVGALMSAVAGLHVDEVRVLAWIAWQLPGRKLRRKCEEATATGWCRTEDPKPTARSTPEDRARAALLAAWRQVVALVHGARSSAAEDLRQRTREDVLADEAARRAGGGR